MEATVEPLTEVEFDAFATGIAEQIIAWLERGQVSLPATIRLPTIEDESVECAGVAKAFSRRLAEGLSDRLAGAVRFGRASTTKPRLRSGISFTDDGAGERPRTVTFRLWDADSSLEICRESYDYQIRPRPLTALRRRLEERRVAARIPREERNSSAAVAVPPVDEPIVAAGEPADAAVEPVAPEAVRSDREPAGKKAIATAVTLPRPVPVAVPREPPKPQPAAPRRTPAVTPDSTSSVPVVTNRRHADLRRTPPRRRVRIDRHEHGLAELVQEQAIHFSDRTITDKLGRLIFLDRRAWESVGIEVRRARRTPDGHLSVELMVQARGRPLEADLRVIYLDADGRQVEVSPVRTYEFSPSYAKHIVFHSSKAGAARYILLIARG
ncbi:MAG: hypothetical protein ACE5I3_06650 [Phycisphaerae bacterium]